MAIIGGSLSLNAAVLADVGFKPVSTAFLTLFLIGLVPIIVCISIFIFIGTITTVTIAGPGIIIAKILGFWHIVWPIGLMAMIAGSLGLNIVCLVDIVRKYKVRNQLNYRSK
jgi:uncharacterized integral membrane protein